MFGKKRQALVNFYEAMEQMMDSGLPLSECLGDGLVDRSLLSGSQLIEMSSLVESGGSLSQSLALFPEQFPSLHIKILQASEKSGQMVEAFRSLAEDVQREIQYREEIFSQLAYPIFLIHFAIFIPNIALILDGIGTYLYGTLPMLLLFYSPVIGLYGVWKIGRFFERGRWFLDKMVLSLPLLGRIFKRHYWIRFFRPFYSLYKSGIPAIEAVEESICMVSNGAIRRELEGVLQKLQGGKTLDEAFSGVPSLPSLASSMIQTGERSGSLDKSLDKILQQLQGQNQRTISRMLKVLPFLVYMLIVLYIGWRVIHSYSGLYRELGQF